MKPTRPFMAVTALVALSAAICFSPAPAAAFDEIEYDAHGYEVNDQGLSMVPLTDGTTSYFRYDAAADVYTTPGGTASFGAMFLHNLAYQRGYRETDPRAEARALRRSQRNFTPVEDIGARMQTRQAERLRKREAIRDENDLPRKVIERSD